MANWTDWENHELTRMPCGCWIQMSRVQAPTRDEAEGKAYLMGFRTIGDVVVSHRRQLPSNPNQNRIWTFTVRPSNQTCREGQAHPDTYVSHPEKEV